MKNQSQSRDVYRIDDPYSFLTKELLVEEYIKNGLSDGEIARKYNIGSKVTVWNRRKYFNIANKSPSKSNQNARKNRKINISLEDAKKFREEGKTYFEIADILGCSRIVVARRFEELGLTKKQIQAQNKLRWNTELTEFQLRFVLGDLLGDGSINQQGMYQCNHSWKQRDYIDYKKDILSSIISPVFEVLSTKIKNKDNGKEYRGCYLRTMQNKELKQIYSRFYRKRTKIFPLKYLLGSVFDEYSLSIWYMDDGSRNNNSATMHTYGFGFEGNLQISRFLYKRFGLCSDIKAWGGRKRNEDTRHCLYFPSSESQKFFSLVASHILPCFQYKLPEKFRK